MIRQGLLSLYICSALPAAAQQTATPVAEAGAPDFSEGLSKLAALGLPDLKGAEWIAAQIESSDYNDYRLRSLLADLKGGCWLIKTSDGKTLALGLGQLEPTAAEAVTITPRRGLLGSIFGGKQQAHQATDLAADVTRLIANLADPKKGGEMQSNFKYYGTSRIENLLIFAAQIHQAGHTAEANRLALALLRFVPDPAAVVDAAVSRFADRDYAIATDAFFKSSDWKAYEQRLSQLLERYPRGWDKAELVRAMKAKVAERAAGKPAPPLRGEPMNTDANAALQAMFDGAPSLFDEETALKQWAKEQGVDPTKFQGDQRKQIIRMLRQSGDNSPVCWLMEKPPEGDTPHARLLRVGMDALPVLIALLGDETLTLQRNHASDSRSFSYNESPAEKMRKLFNSMDRPCSRGEIARELLIPVLPGDHDDSSNDALAESGREFFKQYRGKPMLDLQLAYLREGSSTQKSLACRQLIASKDPAAHKAFEDHVLLGNFTESLNEVQIYIKARKGQAGAFFERYAKAFRAELGDADLDHIENGYQLKHAGGVDKHLKKLEMLVGKSSSRDLALKLAAAEQPDTRQIRSLIESLSEESTQKLVEVIVEAASQAKTVTTAHALLECLTDAKTIKACKQPDGAPTPVAITPTLAAHWKKLLHDTRGLDPAVNSYFSTLAEHASFGFAEIHCQNFTQQQNFYDQAIGADFLAVLKANAEAMCDGKPSVLPSDKNVASERLQKLIAETSKAPVEQVHAMITGWSVEEKLAWLAWCEHAENRERLPANIKAAQRLVVLPDNLPAPVKRDAMLLGIKTGDKMDEQTLRRIAEILSKDPKSSSGMTCGFSPSLYAGIEPWALRLGSNLEQRAAAGWLNYLAEALAEDSSVNALITIASYDGIRADWRVRADNRIDAPADEQWEAIKSAAQHYSNDSNKIEGGHYPFLILSLHRDDLPKLKTASEASE